MSVTPKQAHIADGRIIVSILADQVGKVLDGAIAKSEELGETVTVVVVDSAGEISGVRRMDGARPLHFDFAYGLAYTSAITTQSGSELDWVKNSNWFKAASIMRGGRLMVAPGGIPLFLGDKVIGAIGVSGAPGDLDLQIAEAGHQAL